MATAITSAPTDPRSGWGACGVQMGRLGGTESPVDTGSMGPVPRQPVCTLRRPESCPPHPTFGPPVTTTGDSAEAPLGASVIGHSETLLLREGPRPLLGTCSWESKAVPS